MTVAELRHRSLLTRVARHLARGRTAADIVTLEAIAPAIVARVIAELQAAAPPPPKPSKPTPPPTPRAKAPARNRSEVYQDGRGQWRWRVIANRQIVADSAEGYSRRTTALRGLRVCLPR